MIQGIVLGVVILGLLVLTSLEKAESIRKFNDREASCTKDQDA